MHDQGCLIKTGCFYESVILCILATLTLELRENLNTMPEVSLI